MGFFDFFKKKPSPALDLFNSAVTSYDNGDFDNSLKLASKGIALDANFAPLYRLASDCLGKLDSKDEQMMFIRILNFSSNPQYFYDLANLFFSQDNIDVALALYNKVVALDKYFYQAKHDLSICLARRFRIQEAIVQIDNPNSNDFWDIYFLVKLRILNNETSKVQTTINALHNFLISLEDSDEKKELNSKVLELSDMLKRYNSLSEKSLHIRDWNYIQYGTPILAFDEETTNDTGGKFVKISIANETVKSIILDLKILLEKTDKLPKKLLVLQDRSSQIIGKVISIIFQIEMKLYDCINDNSHSSLIVSSDTIQINHCQNLQSIQDNIVFSFNHNWFFTSNLNPDIIGLMSQNITFPWENGYHFVNGEFVKREQDTREISRIAQDIVDSIISETEINPNLEFYIQQKDYLKGVGTKSNIYRYNFTSESPVPSSYFY